VPRKKFEKIVCRGVAGEMERTNPNKPKRLNLFSMNEMRHFAQEQTQTGYPAYFQMVAGKNRPIFDENGRSNVDLPIPSAVSIPQSRPIREANPNKAKRLKLFLINEINKTPRKQTQTGYLPYFQRVVDENRPIFDQNGCSKANPPIRPADSLRRSRRMKRANPSKPKRHNSFPPKRDRA